MHISAGSSLIGWQIVGTDLERALGAVGWGAERLLKQGGDEGVGKRTFRHPLWRVSMQSRTGCPPLVVMPEEGA